MFFLNINRHPSNVVGKAALILISGAGRRFEKVIF